jgi:transaldolase
VGQAAGARPQRPLWASTSTKDLAYPDTRYLVDLVASGVVNTMPEATLRAVADHGEMPADSVRARYDDAQEGSTGCGRSGSTSATWCRPLRTTAWPSSTLVGISSASSWPQL